MQIHDLRLPCGIGDGGDPFGRHGGQHGVFSGSHAGNGQGDICPGKFSLRHQAAIPLPDLRPQGPKSRKMEVDGTGTQFTAPRIGEF